MGSSLITLLQDSPILPVVVIESAEAAAPLADALIEGGLPCAEVTLRTPAALDALRVLADRPDLLVGAGSVLSAADARQAIAAGARFIVSPGLSEEVVACCRDLGVPALPGVATATEIMRALAAGVEAVKLFPSGQLGGPPGVRALIAPFPGLRVVPTGGVGPANLATYLAEPAVLAVGGSWMVAQDLVSAGRFAEIVGSCRAAAAVAAEVR